MFKNQWERSLKSLLFSYAVVVQRKIIDTNWRAVPKIAVMENELS